MPADKHIQFMRRALRLARRGQGYVEPNPMVGAVLVRAGKQVAHGWHRRYGGPHAEVEALADARTRGVDPAGCDLYVTLEPCCHQGKTPPCTRALIEAGLANVFVALADPFEQVAGRGMAELRAAGVSVHAGVCQGEAKQLNAPYLKRLATGLPWVIAKWAQTIDGRIATPTGDSRWISNEQSRKIVHQWRARVDAVMVGIGTVLKDDPQLTARHARPRRHARPVVIDPNLRIPLSAKLLQQGQAVIVAARRQVIDARPDAADELRAHGVELFGLAEPKSGERILDLRPLLNHLTSAHGATNVLVEGGATLFGSLFAQDLVDQALVFVAPKLMGDEHGLSAVTGLSIDAIANIKAMNLLGSKRVGDDVMLDYQVPHA